MYGSRVLALLSVLLTPASSSLAGGPRPVLERPFVVVLDPGHGGANEGCTGAGDAREKDITLSLAQKVRQRLSTLLPHAVVLMTRENDRTVTLAERVFLANTRGADVFLSLHANASEHRDQDGFETYVLDPEAATFEVARTAQRENDDGFLGPRAPDPVAGMLRELQLNASRERAGDLAATIQREQADRFPDRSNRGVKQAPFDVLLGVRMPAVLFEAGFLDHEREGRQLKDPAVQAEIADGLAEALVYHYRARAHD